MRPDEVMVYSGMAVVPFVAAIAGVLVLLAIRRRAVNLAGGCLVFLAAVPVGMALSYFFVSAFSHLLHGDGALAIIAAPLTGAILTIPVAILFGIAVIAIVYAR